MADSGPLVSIFEVIEDSGCPPPDERLHIMRDWSCEDFNKFIPLEQAFVVDVFLIKSLQVIGFAFLASILIAKQCKGQGSIGRLPILISLFTILNGVCAIVRTAALFPVFGMGQNYQVFSLFYLLEDVAFYLALWLFGIKYYEVSLDMERMIRSSSEDYAPVNWQETARVKKKFGVARIVVSIVILLTHIPLVIASFRNKVSKQTAKTCTSISLVVLALLVLTIGSFMTIALWKFTRAVNRMPFKQDLNRILVAIQIFSIAVWAASAFAIGIEFVVNYDDLQEFKHMRRLTIIDLTSIDANSINFSIIAFILFRSSQVAGLRYEPNVTTNMTFIQFLKSCYNAQQGESSSQTRSSWATSDNPLRISSSNESSRLLQHPQTSRESEFAGQISTLGDERRNTGENVDYRSDGVSRMSVPVMHANNELSVSDRNVSAPKGNARSLRQKLARRHTRHYSDCAGHGLVSPRSHQGNRRQQWEDDIMSSNDWHLCEGLMLVFMKKGSEAQPVKILWHKERSERSGQHGPASASQRSQHAFLDLGSYKQTCYFDNSTGREDDSSVRELPISYRSDSIQVGPSASNSSAKPSNT